ncbi:hypothetical protein FE810_10865 [Thalassotalea litorea]|uniref:Phage holin family protein n=1 Tax=Thalassotalea litorea TaxID=2020715 RepID=A0A5R9IKI4_9GAMM|nr:phage holin family protein [Thalassotalea litorea]TLU64587.1 hypothetical protein FE810_10865 [Thalassotalea litorea]
MLSAHKLKFKLLYKAQSGLLELSLQQLLGRLVFICIALFLLLLTFIFLNIGCYHLLATTFGSWQAAFILGAVNLFLTLLMLWLGRKKPPSKEQQILQQARDMAVSEIQADGQQAKELFSPGSLSSSHSLITLVSLMLDVIRKRKLKG